MSKLREPTKEELLYVRFLMETSGLPGGRISKPAVHVAGPVVEKIQRCSKCPMVLNDYRHDPDVLAGKLPYVRFVEGDFVDFVGGEAVYKVPTEHVKTWVLPPLCDDKTPNAWCPKEVPKDSPYGWRGAPEKRLMPEYDYICTCTHSDQKHENWGGVCQESDCRCPQFYLQVRMQIGTFPATVSPGSFDYVRTIPA